MNILVTRTDRLGDVLLATPVLKQLCAKLPHAKITFLVQKQWMDVLRYGEKINLMVWDPQEPQDLFLQRLKQKTFDVALVLKDDRAVSWALKKAKIPIRIGPYSTLRSFFLFNRGLMQRRSRCLMHEAEYNVQLLTRLGIEQAVHPAATVPSLRSWIEISDQHSEQAVAWINSRNLLPKQYLCVHPGSSGSARYLKPSDLSRWVSRLVAETPYKLILTGSESEAALLNQIADEAKLPQEHIFGGASGTQPLGVLAALYRNAEGVVAHGTGPLHLAAATGTKVYAIFPPLFVLSEKRWGPLSAQRTVWTPPVRCPEKYRCRGERCDYFDCMEKFNLDEAVTTILGWKA